MTNVPTATKELLSETQKKLLRGKISLRKWRIKNYNYENGGLKSADMFSKRVSLQCPWIKDYMMKTFIPEKSNLYI